MKIYTFIKNFIILLFTIFASCDYCEAASISLDPQEIEYRLKKTKHCSSIEAKEFLSSLNKDPCKLTQDEIAEALRLSQSTVSNFLRNESSSVTVCNQLSWYYTYINTPLSSLKENWLRSDLDEYSHIEDNFMESRSYVLLPKKFHNKKIIKNYLSELIEDGNKEDNIKVISDALPIKADLIHDFLMREDQNSFKPIYIALRNYYCSCEAKRLSELIAKRKRERESCWSFMDMLRSLPEYMIPPMQSPSKGYKAL